MQPDGRRIRGAAGKRQAVADLLIRIDILDLIEALQQADDDVSGLRQGELLADADPRAAVERDVIPVDLPVHPAVGVEAVCVFAPDILAALQNVRLVHDRLALADVDRLETIRAAAAGERCVSGGCSAVQRDDRVQAEDFVESVLQVLAGLEGTERDVPGLVVGAEFVDDGLAEFLENVRMAGEQKNSPAEQGGGGVASSQEDIEELRAKLNRVLGRRGERIQENIVGRFLFVSFRLLFLNHFQCPLDEAVHESVHLLVGVAGFLVVDQPVECLKPASLGGIPLRLVEVVRELLSNLSSQSCGLCLNALSEQEFSCRVDGKAEEDGLDIGCRRPAVVGNRQRLHCFLDMAFLQI